MNVLTSRAFIPVTVCIFAGLTTAIAYHPAQVHAATTPPQLINIPCSSAKPCASVSNKGAGIAISGAATNSSAVIGATTALNAPPTTINGLTFGLTGGVVGNDVSGSPLIGGGNVGVVGLSLYSEGILGITSNAFNYGAGTDVATFSGVPAIGGFDAGPNTGIDGSGNVGVAGRSLTRVGGLFLSRSGYGAVGRSFTGTGVLGVGRAGGAIALAATSLAGGPIFIGNNATAQVASLDSSGNLLLAGSIRTGDTAQFATKSASGGSVVTYGGRQSMATVEDFGQVQMHAGTATVQLDPAFARIMDQQRAYLVFITPEGDNRGVYVTNKTAGGFIVRESSGGHSSLSLSYRIVAHAFGAHDTRFVAAPATPTLATARHAPAVASARQLVSE